MNEVDWYCVDDVEVTYEIHRTFKNWYTRDVYHMVKDIKHNPNKIIEENYNI